MKKYLILALLGFCVATAGAQEKSKTDSIKIKNNEIKINLLMTVLGLPEISYERILDEETGIGISANIGVDENLADYSYMVLPYYRFYFGRQRANGFYIEANAGLIGYRGYDNYVYTSNGTFTVSHYDGTTNFGAGAAVGFKFFSRKNIVGEAHAGLGRVFGSNSGSEAYPRIGITVGKRF